MMRRWLQFSDGEIEIGVGIGLVLQGEMPPFALVGLETVVHHSLTKLHAVVELLARDSVVGEVLNTHLVDITTTAVGMALATEPIERTTHIEFFARGYVEEGEIDGRAASVAALTCDIL